MMLLDELIQMMIGMSDDQLRKIKSFILIKLSIKAKNKLHITFWTFADTQTL